MGPSAPKIFRDDFSTRMGPSVSEIFRGDFSLKWDHLRSKRRFYLEESIIVERLFCQFVFPPFLICLLLLVYIFYLICPFLLAYRFSTKWDNLCPRYLGMISSPEWDHLCPKYLDVIFYPRGTTCAQNVRFYLEATIIVERLFCQFVIVFFPFLIYIDIFN